MCQLKKDPRLLRDRKYTILDICRPTFEFSTLSIIIIHLRTRLNEINSYEWLLVQIYLAMHSYYKNFFQQNITVPKINLFFFFIDLFHQSQYVRLRKYTVKSARRANLKFYDPHDQWENAVYPRRHILEQLTRNGHTSSVLHRRLQNFTTISDY